MSEHQEITDHVNDAIDQISEEFPELGKEVEQLEVEIEPNFNSIGVSTDGIFYIDPEFVEDFSDEMYQTAVAQMALRYTMGVIEGAPDVGEGHRDWNLAQNLVINYILVHDLGFEPGDKGLFPTEEGAIEIPGEEKRTVTGLDEKTVEEVYEELTGSVHETDNRTTRDELDFMN